MTAFQPEAFGKYFLVDKIATGGMAEIFKAKTFGHGGFEHLLVIKRILKHLGDNEDFVEMFIDEAKVSVALQHANIIRIYDFGKILDNYFIAMEWVDGKDARNILKKLSRQRKFLPFEYAAYIAHEGCKGLDYAHRKANQEGVPYGIVHRDVSPSNLLVSYEGDVKVADFGIAKAESNAYDTKAGVLKGKFEYMSPEQAEGHEIDHRSDIFSLGIILHEMLTGRRLFKTGNDAQTIARIKSADVPLPSSLHPRVPEALDRIVMKALTRDRNERYQSARDMADDLNEFLKPATTDQLRQQAATFMTELFIDEIAEEKQRLQEGSKVAEELRKTSPTADGWEGHTNSTMTASQASVTVQRRAVIPLAIGGALMVALLLIVAVVGSLGGAAYFSQAAPASVPSPQKPTTGSLTVAVSPAADLINLDGAVVGHGTGLTLEALAPGDHKLHFEAAGYSPIDKIVHVEAGKSATDSEALLAVAHTATAEPPHAAAAFAPAAAEPAHARFESSPAGATVSVNGQMVGKTPFTWDGAVPGQTYAVEVHLNGYKAGTGTLSGLARGQTTPFGLTLSPEAVDPGKLAVALVGGGWANVWVDGQKLEKTAPMSGFDLKPGTHQIRVANPGLGIDTTQAVTVRSGETSKVTASPQ